MRDEFLVSCVFIGGVLLGWMVGFHEPHTKEVPSVDQNYYASPDPQYFNHVANEEVSGGTKPQFHRS